MITMMETYRNELALKYQRLIENRWFLGVLWFADIGKCNCICLLLYCQRLQFLGQY